jgi:hypothetical protein
MTQHGIGPARKHRRHEPALSSYVRVADGVNATIKAMQQPRLQAPLNLPATEAEGQELPGRHHSVLIAGQFGDCRFTRSMFSTHTVVKMDRVEFSPPLEEVF